MRRSVPAAPAHDGNVTTGVLPRLAETWPEHFNVNPAHAKGLAVKPGFKAIAGTLKIARLVLGARFSGRWRQSPFFRRDSQALVAQTRTLTLAELQQARGSIEFDRG